MSCGISHGIGKGYCWFARVCNYLQSPLLLLIRLYWGWHFFLAGFGKLGNIQPVIEFFTSIGIPFPTFNAYFVGLVECLGGLLLLVGLFSRFAALFLTGTMLVALYTAFPDTLTDLFHNPSALFSKDPFLFLYAALIVLAFGAGAFSLDWLWQRCCGKEKNHKGEVS